jgi:hypothetical protein
MPSKATPFLSKKRRKELKHIESKILEIKKILEKAKEKYDEIQSQKSIIKVNDE